jgi:hypothetical protein
MVNLKRFAVPSFDIQGVNPATDIEYPPLEERSSALRKSIARRVIKSRKVETCGELCFKLSIPMEDDEMEEV